MRPYGDTAALTFRLVERDSDGKISYFRNSGMSGVLGLPMALVAYGQLEFRFECYAESAGPVPQRNLS